MRKQRLWKKVSGVLAAAMVLCAVSGCSKEAAESPEVSEPSKAKEETAGTEEKEGTQETAEAETSGIPELPLKEPVTINVMALADAGRSVDYENMSFWKQVEEETGIKVNWTVAKGDEFTQKKNLMFASGEYPDVIFGGGISVNEEESYGVEQQILIPLDEYINEESMPNYYSLLETILSKLQRESPVLWNLLQKYCRSCMLQLPDSTWDGFLLSSFSPLYSKIFLRSYL